MSKLEIITEPTVAIVGYSATDDGAIANWLEACGVKDWTSDAPSDGEKLVEFGARACYHSFNRPRPGGNAAMVANLLKQGHGSCLEHAVFTVAIAGVSRSLTHELIRHRHLSPSQLSQRYYDESSARFVVPPLFLPKPGEAIDPARAKASQFLHYTAYMCFVRWFEFIQGSLRDYEYLVTAKLPSTSTSDTLARKRQREAARSVLPNCVETRIILTGNARAWRGVIEQRGTIHADLEIRRLAVAIFRKLQSHAPHLFADAKVFTDGDGRESVRFIHRKV